MQHEHFEELKKWSERKHELVIAYLEGFVKILGGATKDKVYYVDGFAGPGIYNDGAKGSPILAAEHARALSDKTYRLYCINVEENKDRFYNLEQSTSSYQHEVKNYLGNFGNHVTSILEQINNFPTIFFLDPFGIKGLEWAHIHPILERPATTELLLRINPKDISRLAGFSGSDSRGAERKRKVLTELYGFTNSTQWEQIWHESGSEGLLNLYVNRVLKTMSTLKGKAYVCLYSIKSIEGTIKYYLLFATRHPKGAILMSDTIYKREKCYEYDVENYKRECLENQPFKQIPLFDYSNLKPSEEEISENIVRNLKEDIWQEFAGKTINRRTIHIEMLHKWFGKIKSSHITRALKELEETDSRITYCSGARSKLFTEFTFSINRTSVL